MDFLKSRFTLALLRNNGWNYAQAQNRTEGRWIDPVTGEYYTTGQALEIQAEREKETQHSD